MSAPEPSAIADGVTVHPVRRAVELQEFIDLPLRLHPTSHYVPLWQDTIRSWYGGRGPHTRHSHVELFLARDSDGAVVGRTTLHTDARLDARLGVRTELLGATEVAGPAALTAFAALAEKRARAAGRQALFGPVSLLPNQTGGVIISGFDERGFLDSPWNPAWVPGAWASAGFTPTLPAATWICRGLQDLDPDAIFPRGHLPAGVQLHQGSKKKFDEQLPLLRTMLNASFAELPYFTQIDAAELAAATDGLAHLLDESLLLYLTRGSTPLAFILTIPDVSEFVMSTGGELNLLDKIRLVATRRKYRREAVLVIKGTVPKERGQRLMSILSRDLLRNLKAGGYETLRVTFIGEDNGASAAQFAAMGGRPLHGLTFYRKDLR